MTLFLSRKCCKHRDIKQKYNFLLSCIFCILQPFTTKLCNFTHCKSALSNYILVSIHEFPFSQTKNSPYTSTILPLKNSIRDIFKNRCLKAFQKYIMRCIKVTVDCQSTQLCFFISRRRNLRCKI